MPAFSTVDGAFAPFKIDSSSLSSLANMSWTARTSMYSTTLKCKPAIIAPAHSPGFTFDDGGGCHTDGIQFSQGDNNYTALYIGYHDDPNIDWSLAQLGCPITSLHSFLAIWAKDSDLTTNGVTGMFCRPEYWVQSVNVTVTVPEAAVTGFVSLEPPSMLPDTVFNVSAFEYLIGSGIGSNPPIADVPRTALIDQRPRINNMSVAWPTTNMVGFALGISRQQPAQYLNPTTLATSFESAHKLLFALAASSIMTTNVSSPGSQHATISDNVSAIVVIRVLAIIIEVFFGLITIFAFAILWISRNRPSQLKTDPASLVDIMRMVEQTSPGPTENPDIHLQVEDRPIVELKDGKLLAWARTFGMKQSTENHSTGQISHSRSAQSQVGWKSESKLIRPKEMTLTVAFVFISVLSLAVTALTIIQINIRKRNGLPLPSKNPVVVQLVLNYVPIVFATFLEPFWVLLNRLLCILKPFEELRSGEARLSKSLGAKYTSLPPQLVFWRALSAGHYLLVAVCAMGLSGSLLTVSLGAIFETGPTHLSSNGHFTARFLPQLRQASPPISQIGFAVDYSDHFHVAETNITNKTPLPPWVSPQNFYLPVTLNSTSNLGDVQYSKVKTQGFGVDVKCAQINTSGSNITLALNRVSIANWYVLLNVRDNNGRNFSCISWGPDGIGNLTRNYPGVESAAQITTIMSALDQNGTVDQAAFCSSMLLMGFLRSNDSNALPNPIPSNDLQDLSGGHAKALWLGCRPALLTADFEVTVDLSGRVLSSTRTGPVATNLSSYFTNNQNASALYASANDLISSNRLPLNLNASFWHNDTFADTWLPYLLKIYTNSTDFLSGSAPVPLATSIAPVIEDLYTRLFAIILGLNTDMFVPAPPGTTTSGTTVVSCTRVFMSQSMYIIATTLLSLNVVVAVAYYARRPKRMLPCMPITIASVLELFQGSGLVSEVALAKGGDWEDWKIGYGRFVGIDGRPHIGIERRPFVIPLGKSRSDWGP